MLHDRTMRAAVILAVLVAAAGLGLAQQADIVLTPGDTVQVTDGELRGLSWLDAHRRVALVARVGEGDVASSETVTLEWFDGERLTRSKDVTGLLTRGLAYDGKYLWSLGQPAGSAEARLYKLEGDTLFVDGEYPTPGHAPRDLAWDGTAVWMVDRDRGRLDRFDPEKEEVTRSLPTPGFSPVGLTSDGRHLWVADKGTGRLYRLSPGGSIWNGTVVRESFAQRGNEVMLSSDGEVLWVIPVAGGVIWELSP
jgi:DNA-binding beta-propeller fold protein YncE